MAQIPQINNPITAKNYNYSSRPMDANTEPFDIVKLTGIGGANVSSDSGARARLEMGNRELIPLSVQVAKDPTLAVETLKDLLNVEVLNQALITGHTELYGKLEDLARDLYVTPEQLVEEIQSQEQQNTMFSGHEFYDVLRDVAKTTTDPTTKEIIGNLLKSLNFAQNKNEILGALRANMKFLSEYFSPNEKLSAQLATLSQQWGADDAEQFFDYLKGQTLSILKDVSGSLLNDDKTQMLIPLITHNLSRYNNSPYMCKEYFNLLLSQTASGTLRESLKNSFSRLYSALFGKKDVNKPNGKSSSANVSGGTSSGMASSKAGSSRTTFSGNASSQPASAGMAPARTAYAEELPSGTVPFGNASSETVSSETTPNGTIPAETASNGTAPAETASNGTAPAETASNGTAPAETASNGTTTANSASTELVAAETEFADTALKASAKTPLEQMLENPTDDTSSTETPLDNYTTNLPQNQPLSNNSSNKYSNKMASESEIQQFDEIDDDDFVEYDEEDFEEELTGYNKFLFDSMNQKSFMPLLKQSGYNIEHLLVAYARGKTTGMETLERLIEGLFVFDETGEEFDAFLEDFAKIHTVQEAIDKLNEMLRSMPDIPIRERLYGSFVQIIEQMALKNELPQHGVRPPVSSTLDCLTEFIEENINHPALKSLDSFNATNLLQSLLNAPGVFTPLAHYILPLDVNGTKAFGELWVDNDENNPNNTPGTQRNYHLFLTFDVESIGRFELDMYALGEDVNLALLYPPRFEKQIDPMKDRVNKIIRNIGYNARTFETAPLKAPHNLTEIFPKIVDKRTTLNTRV